MDRRLVGLRGDERGSSLAEVLVALLLLSFAVLAAAPMFVLAARQNTAGADMGRIGARAVSRMELLRTVPFHDLTPGGSLVSDVSGYFDASDPDVTVRWEVVDGGGPTGTRTLAVRAMATRQALGNPRSLELRSLRVQ